MSLQEMNPLSHNQEDHWIPLSDLMTGLMLIFMLVAIVFMLQVQRDAKKAKAQADEGKKVVSIYKNMRAELFQDLYAEFERDLPKWKAKLDPDLSLRFQEPSVQFITGQATINPEFAEILKSFFPRYIRILNSQKYRNEIEEVRIEGHTSSIWGNLPAETAYYENMKLSQERTRTVLQFVFGLAEVRNEATLRWLVEHVTANGLSSAKLVVVDGRQDVRASQRVEFRVKTKADERVDEILKALSK
jgi:outer membrane protein OmpA-like peptidoglycan-associated protein